MEERLLSLTHMLLQPIISFLLCLVTSYACSQATEISSLHAPNTFVPFKNFFNGTGDTACILLLAN